DFGDKDGVGKAARLQHPLGITWHDGKLYVADSYNHKIKIIDPETKSAATFLGDGKPGKEDGSHPRFSEPAGLNFLGEKLFIADTNNNAIRVADAQGGEVHTLQINGLKAPLSTARETVDQNFAPNSEAIKMPQATLKADSDVVLVFDAELPSGYHLNPEASLSYAVTTDAPLTV